MNELVNKDHFLKIMATTEVAPAALKTELNAQSYGKLPLSQLAALGVGLEPVVSAIQQITNHGQAVSGYYKVTIPKGTHLASFHNRSDFLGTALENATNCIDAQARLNPLLCNPTLLFAAAALMSMDRKLDALQETQREMMDFLLQKEISKQKGDLDFLSDVLENYRFNWDNDKFKTANHSQVLAIRREAGQQVDFFREQVKKNFLKCGFLSAARDVQKQLDELTKAFQSYQLALYLHGYAYFLEILLQESFDSAYLNAAAAKLEQMSLAYRELYTEAYECIEKRAQSSPEAYMLRGVSSASKALGETIAKLPVISRSQVDESLIEAGQKIGDYEKKRTAETMRKFVEHQSSCVHPFVDQIQSMNRIYHGELTMIFNDETLYLGTA